MRGHGVPSTKQPALGTGLARWFELARQREKNRAKSFASSAQERFDRLLGEPACRCQVPDTGAGDVLGFQRLAVVLRQLRHRGVDEAARFLTLQYVRSKQLILQALVQR